MVKKNPLGITEVVLRDAHQSLLATRVRLEDLLPVCKQLDEVGYWSVESWGGATFDACIRYLGEDPWERLRAIKAEMPKTRQQMLIRGQNILGYRHYADDVVDKFIERSAVNGIDVFRIFDAMNDVRNLECAVKSVLANGKHAQGTISYTVSPVHSLSMWVDLGRKIEDLGAHSLCIKDMAGLLLPYTGYELIKQLKQSLNIPIHLHAHATTGLSLPTLLKAIEAGIDNVDTAISSMSMTYGHSPTETVVAMLAGQPQETGLDIVQLETIAAYFRTVRKKYASFEGSLKGIDSRIMVAQVPGGMLTNMESQLKEQGAADRMDEVLTEIPKVREDLGYIPLVTPTSQIVGTQAVINVLSGERYKTLSKEVAGVLRGEYGATPVPVNPELQQRVIQQGETIISGRPADQLAPEMEQWVSTVKVKAETENVALAENVEEDALIDGLFSQIGWKFIQHRNDPSAFEAKPTTSNDIAKPKSSGASAGDPVEVYSVKVGLQVYEVKVGPKNDDLTIVKPVSDHLTVDNSQQENAPQYSTEPLAAPMTGLILKIVVDVGEQVQAGQVVVILEAMKMETEVCAKTAGTVTAIHAREGASVAVNEPLISF